MSKKSNSHPKEIVVIFFSSGILGEILFPVNFELALPESIIPSMGCPGISFMFLV